MTNRARAVAYAYIALCTLALVSGTVLCLGLLFSGERDSGQTALKIGMPFLYLSLVYFIPGLVGGLGLLKGKPWARIVVLVLSVLVLFLIPVGTLFGGWAIWALWHDRTAPPAEPPTSVAPNAWSRFTTRTNEEKSRATGLFIAAAGVGSAFVIMIGTGYRLTNDPTSPISDGVFYGAILVFFAVVGFGVRAWSLTPAGRHAIAYRFGPEGRQLKEASRQFHEDRRRRVAELTADPVRRKYAERVARGEAWSNEQIDYNENPASVATCVHLQPIERAMREAGVYTRLASDLYVAADCCLDLPTLTTQFAPAPSVRYTEPPMWDRGAEDVPGSMLVCEACQSAIDAVHPRRATAGTQWFPPGAGPVHGGDAARADTPATDR